ncbi:hypothetical protein AAF712_016841 [Marasmius tenuissimus]|uniref:F-box domain-containing protein n=1 Tax=Marasmius tenuissimus TaxID=585030 RepID=A0ABR2Z5R0_9AGAR
MGSDTEDEDSPAYQARRRRDRVHWELMDLIAEHDDRWHSFNIDTFHEAVHESVDYIFSVSEDVDPPPFQRLKCATIDMSHYGAPTVYETVMQHAPNLSTLTLKYEYSDEFPEVLPQMAKIRHLILEAGTSTTPWADLMRSCPHLRSFVYRGDKGHGSLLGSCNHALYQKPNQPEPTVECKELESISIDLACLDFHGKPNYDLLSSFFTAVKAPSLQSLTMYAEDPHFDISIFTWPRGIITSFVSAVRPSRLRTLSIKDLPVDVSDLLALLELTPFLEELTVAEHRSKSPYHLTTFPHRDHTDQFHQTITKSFLNRLRVSPDGSSSRIFLPGLRFLKFSVHERHFDGGHDFVEMVRSRSSIPVGFDVAPLRRVELSLCMHNWKDELLNGVYEPLKALERERGMQISVLLLTFLGTAMRIV